MKPSEEVRVWDSIHFMGGIDPLIYGETKPPYVSLYVPVHHNNRAGGMSDEDRIQLKDLIAQARADLQRDYAEADIKGIHDRMRFIEEHPDWLSWQKAKGGMAFLISNTDVFVFMLEEVPQAYAIVGETYFIKPLIKESSLPLCYYILALSNDRFAFIEGTEKELRRLAMPDDVDDEFSETYATYDGIEGALDYQTLEGHMTPYHGYRSRNDVEQLEGEKFFRYVNKAVNDTFKMKDATPVILACLPEHKAEFLKICTIHDMVPQTIDKDPNGLDAVTLLDDAVAIMRAEEQKKTEALIDDIAAGQAKDKASTDAEEIAHAIFENRVGTLIVASDVIVPGTYDASAGTISLDPATDPADDKKLDPASPDILDALAQAALASGAHVVLLEKAQMPEGAVAAALYRY